MTVSRLVQAVECGYALPQTEEAWIAEVVGALRPHLDSGLGTFGWLYDAHDFSRLKFTHPIFRDVDPKIPEALFAANGHATTTVALRRRHYETAAGPFSLSLGAAFKSYVGWREYMPAVGVEDLIVLNGMDPDRLGCAIIAPRRTVSRIGAPRRALLARVASHLATGLRLMRRLRAHTAPQGPEPEAIFDGSGKLHHATGAARAHAQSRALTAAVKAMDRARGKLRRVDPEESLRIWRAMIDGRWSLIDRFESDGRHFVVAHVNEPVAPWVDKLSPRERQIAAWTALGRSNKAIGYSLGVAATTVSTHLARAVRKLGLRSPADLLRVFSDDMADKPSDDEA